MRFAYIDSQGNEVPIPSIDALALRIELGAVRPETELYDAQADHWGPAHTHEIFHSLARDAGGDTFLAPPPPVASTPSKSAGPPSAGSASAPADTEQEPAPETEGAPPEGAEEAESKKDFGLTLADPVPTPPPPQSADDDENRALGDIAMEEARRAGLSASEDSEETEEVEAPIAADDAPALELDDAPALELDDEQALQADEQGLELDDEPAIEPDGGGFDFGDLGSDLELEEPSASDDLAIETGMEFQSPPADLGGVADDLDLEEPMSAFDPASPPGWTEESGPDDVMDFSTVGAEEESTEEVVAPVAEAPTRQRRTPKDRPSPPKFRRQTSVSGPIVWVVVLISIGVGGYYAWPFVQAELAERSVPERPAVAMPQIPEELLPRMRSLAETAIGAVVSEVSEETSIDDAPAEPHDDWLAGVYLGNASQYADVEAFWSSMGAFTAGLREADWQRYHEKYEEAVAEAGLEADVAARLAERADSGFVAAQPERSAAYAELERLIDAALDLHDFLLVNEADILFRPGVTSTNDASVDPVLEIAAPEDDRDVMLEMFDEITDALEAIGSLDRVTRDRLVTAMTARLRQVGIE